MKVGKAESVKSVVELDLDFVVATVTFRLSLASNSPRLFFSGGWGRAGAVLGLRCSEQGLLSHCCVRASLCSGGSCCRAWLQGTHRLQELLLPGWRARLSGRGTHS